QGSVLEVGCGPIGFFELTRGVRVTAIDSLMGSYAAELRYATLGVRGSSCYVHKSLDEVDERYAFVVCTNLLDSCADWTELLEHLVGAVEKGGELLLVTDARRRPVAGCTQVFTPEQLRRALRWLGTRGLGCFRVEDPTSALGDHRVL